jgi:hypothetical protein
MLLGVIPRPYVIFDEDDPTFGEGFPFDIGGVGDLGDGIPPDLIGVWRTTGATLTFSGGGTGSLRMDDGFYAGFRYRVEEKKRIYFSYDFTGYKEEEDYSKILTLTSTTLTLQATDVSAGNYMGATTTYTKQ